MERGRVPTWVWVVFLAVAGPLIFAALNAFVLLLGFLIAALVYLATGPR
jgi:hypothetical protein